MSWGSLALTEALKRFNRAEAEEEKNRWAKTLMIITDSLNTTLERDITFSKYEEKKRKKQKIKEKIERERRKINKKKMKKMKR